MEQARLAMIVAAALTATTFNANAQDGDVAAGRIFAREACITCHVVEPGNASPRVVAIGPDFRDIANTKGMTATALRVFLTTSRQPYSVDQVSRILTRCTGGDRRHIPAAAGASLQRLPSV